MSWASGVEALTGRGPADSAVTQAGFIVMPATVLAYMKRVDAQMQNLNADIAKSNVRAEFKEQWGRFHASWRTFFEDHQSWWSRGWGSVYDETEKYEVELRKWFDAFQREGGQPVAPSPPNPTEPPASAINFNALFTVVGIVGGLFAAGYLLRSLPSFKGAS